MNRKGKLALFIAATISIGTAAAHLSCILIGPVCFKTQMAPPAIIQSAIDGTWLAPVGTTVISLLFIACGLFALSGAGYIRKLPFLNLALIIISGLCVLRGLSTLPLSFIYPDMVSVFSVSAGVVWFFTGLLFTYGYLHVCRKNS